MQLEEIFEMGNKVSAVLAPANLHCKLYCQVSIQDAEGRLATQAYCSDAYHLENVIFAVSRTEAIRQIALDKITHHNWEFDPDNAFAIMYWADPNQGLIINVTISIEIKGK